MDIVAVRRRGLINGGSNRSSTCNCGSDATINQFRCNRLSMAAVPEFRRKCCRVKDILTNILRCSYPV